MRIKRGVAAHRRHKKILKQAKGYKHGRKKLIRRAKEAILKAGQHAYRDRRRKKREFRRLWIVRINAAAREHGLTYRQFMHGLKEAKIDLDRKVLSELAVKEPETFKELVEKTKV